jgi:hypothetical protein
LKKCAKNETKRFKNFKNQVKPHLQNLQKNLKYQNQDERFSSKGRIAQHWLQPVLCTGM